MSEKELWAQYVAKNPAFAGDGNITMSAAGLRKLFSQTYAKAHDQGVANGRARAALESKTSGVFDGIFGGGKR